MRGKSHPEFYICFHMGLKPMDLVARGFKRSSVYNYYKRYNREVKPNVANIFKLVQTYS